MSEKKIVSVIIPTFNSARYLEACLKSIKLQTYKNTEVLVIDNCSNDRTSEITRKFGYRLISKKLNRSEARNYGAKKASGEYLLFIDSDMELTEGVISNCIHKMDKTVMGVVIPEISVGDGFWSECKKIEKLLYQNSSFEAPRFFRQKDFIKVGGMILH